jgi:hypothetical protein
VGPPPIAPLIFPNVLFDNHLELRVGEIALDLRMSPKSFPIMATRTSSRKGDTIRP